MFLARWPVKISALAGAFISLTFCVIAASQNRDTYLAQKLVNETHNKHPEANQIGIATTGSKGCTTIASTNKQDIGEKCEAQTSEPIRTGKPRVEKKGQNVDVTLPLHDQSGRTVGSVGIELAAKSGERQAEIVKRAQEIARGMEAAIPSKVSLTQTF